MKRKFITNLVLLLFLNLLVKPFWIFGIDRTVQNTVGSTDYGFYFSLFSFSILLNIILDAGIANYNNRNIAQNKHLLTSSFSQIIGLKFVLGVIYAIVCLASAFIIGYNRVQMHLLYFLIISQFLAQLILYLRSNISGLLLLRTDSILSVLDRTLMIIVCSILLWGNVFKSPFRIEWFVYAQTFTYALTAIISFIIVLTKVDHFKPVIRLSYFYNILKKSFPYALLVLLMAIYYRIDSVMLERLLPDGRMQAGIYAQAFRIVDAFGQFAFLFAGLLLPIFSNMLKKKENIESMVQLSSMILIIPSIIVAVSASFYSKNIIQLLYHEHTAEASSVFQYIILGFIGISATYIFGTLLTANGNLRQLNIMAAAAVIINITLDFILIPKFKATGSGMVCLTVQILTGLAQILMAVKILRIRINIRLLSAIGSFVIILLACGYIMKIYISNWVFGFFGLIFFGLGVGILLRILKVRDYLQIIKQREEAG
ncbi:MAG: polysaccharide biosynthesis protein [Bacteroidales bacterium]|nr:polysaccharide biosynthesis protein [Bacteroidales bacterium]